MKRAVRPDGSVTPEGLLAKSWKVSADGRVATILPVPFLNVVNGGRHAGFSVDIQE